MHPFGSGRLIGFDLDKEFFLCCVWEYPGNNIQLNGFQGIQSLFAEMGDLQTGREIRACTLWNSQEIALGIQMGELEFSWTNAGSGCQGMRVKLTRVDFRPTQNEDESWTPPNPNHSKSQNN